MVPALYSPIADDAKLTRQPVASADVLASEHGPALAGWEQIVAESSGPGWLRISMVVVDARGTLLSVNDAVTEHGTERVRAGGTMVDASVIESAGGSITQDGTLRGTRWSSRVIDDASATPEAPSVESTPRTLGDADLAGLRAIAATLLERGKRA
ncbi:MAG TPA: hypothetical protein VF761_15305 [Gemmatimonadaceae bacterium]